MGAQESLWRSGSAVACCRGGSTECSSVRVGRFEGAPHDLLYLHHSLASGQATGKEHSPAHQQKIGLKIYWTRPRPSEQDPVSPQSVSPDKPLILIHQRAGRMKSIITENKPVWSHRPQPCLTQWNYEPCHVGPPKMDRSWWRVLIKRGPLGKGMANHFSILALRTPYTCWPSVYLLWKIFCSDILPNFLIKFFAFLILSYMNSLYMLDTNS